MLKQELSQRSELKREIIIEILTMGLDLQKIGLYGVSNNGYMMMYESVDSDNSKLQTVKLSGDFLIDLSKMSIPFVSDLYSEIKRDVAKYKRSPEFTKSNVMLTLNRIDKDLLYKDRPTHASESQWYVVPGKKAATDGLSHKEQMRRELTDYYEQSQ